MSPTSNSSIYDHLILHGPSTSKTNFRHQTPLSHSSNIEIHPKRKLNSIKNDENSKQRRFTITNVSQPSTVIHYTVQNQSYDQPLLRKSSTTHSVPRWRPDELTCYQIPPVDFRPLIIQGRRKFRPIPTSASMIIVKKKMPQRFSTTDQVKCFLLFSFSFSFSI